ncbi:MAG: hypothetical protein Q7T96_18590 [Methylobacter sp.]|nr:hypothetical protein [Methylobacter sp.]
MWASHLRRNKILGLTIRPEPIGFAQESLVEGWTVNPFVVRQAHHERLNLRLSLLKLEVQMWESELIVLIF